MQFKNTITFAVFAFLLAAKLCAQDLGPFPKCEPTFETFDERVFTKAHGQAKSSERKQPGSGRTIYIYADYYTYLERDSAGTTIKHFTRAINNPAVTGYDYSENPMIGIFKEFYVNGAIKQKGAYCRLGFKIGNWYDFNAKHKVSKAEDTDKGFAFNFEKVLEFCRTNNVPMGYDDASRLTDVRKADGKWAIRYLKPGTNIIRSLTLDGQTGTILHDSEEAYDYGE